MQRWTIFVLLVSCAEPIPTMDAASPLIDGGASMDLGVTDLGDIAPPTCEGTLHLCETGCCPWVIETIDTESLAGSTTSIVLDPEGTPHISYADNCDRGRGRCDIFSRYARRSGGQWRIETIDGPGAGWHSSIALDLQGVPHVAYYEPSGGNLKYARRDPASGWVIQTVDEEGAVGRMPSIQLDRLNRPHISYHDTTHDDLKYARWTGDTWQIEVVDSDDAVGDYTDLALDTLGRAHISYFHLKNANDADYGNLKYAHFDGAQWRIETVDAEGLVGWFTSIAVDGENRPHISYAEERPSWDVKYAHLTDDGWLIERVETVGETGDFRTSIAIDLYDRPHMTFYESSQGALRYTYRSEAGWVIQTVSEENYSGAYAALALDRYGTPHISFTMRDNPDLMASPDEVNIWLMYAR